MSHGAGYESLSTKSPLLKVTGVILPLLAGLSFFVTPYMILASLAYFLMVAGLIYRTERLVHMRLMITSVTLDVLLVLILEAQRSAVKTAVVDSLSYSQYTHIIFSLLAVLMYAPAVYLGWKRYTGKSTDSQNKYHRYVGLTAFLLRSVGYVFMYSMFPLLNK